MQFCWPVHRYLYALAAIKGQGDDPASLAEEQRDKGEVKGEEGGADRQGFLLPEWIVMCRMLARFAVVLVFIKGLRSALCARTCGLARQASTLSPDLFGFDSRAKQRRHYSYFLFLGWEQA